MSILFKQFEKCCDDHGRVDLRLLMERFSLNFENISLSDVRFIEGECSEIRTKFEDAEKVKCFKTYKLTTAGFSDTVYFREDEEEIVKDFAKQAVEKGFFDFTVAVLNVSQTVLNGHIRDREEWNANKYK